MRGDQEAINAGAEGGALEALPAATAIEAESADQPGRGIALMVLAAGLMATMDALVKWLSPTFHTLELVFFRNLFAFIPLAFYLWRQGSLSGLKTKRPLGHVMRAILGIASISGFFYAYAHMPLASVVAIGFAAPIFVTAFSVPMLGEKVGPRRWSAVAVGFLGVVIMIRPDPNNFNMVALLVLGATVLYALVMIYLRKMSRTETSSAIVFYYALASVIVTGATLPFFWVTPSLGELGLLAALGLIGGVGQIAMTNAFRLADAAVVAPFDYTAIVWATLLGYIFWGEMPVLTLWIGVAIVIASGLYIIYREAHLNLPRGIARRFQARR